MKAVKKQTIKKAVFTKTEKPKKGTYEALVAAAEFAKKSGLFI